MREGIDKIEIESFSCTQCNVEARNIIFLPCRDCYLCEQCYKEKKQDKFKCDRCNAKINALIKMYVSKNA